MKKTGILNAQLMGLITALGHKDQFMIADAGMPIPKAVSYTHLDVYKRQAYAAGISAGLYDPDRVYEHVRRRVYSPAMDEGRREELYRGWQAAVRQVLTHD